MSRIDEALRRASEAKGTTLPESLDSTDDRVTLEDYPGEARSAVLPKSAQPSTYLRIEDDRAVARIGRLSASEVVGLPGARSEAVEHYRRLAALLHEAQVERGIKTLLVTSAVPREGKTVTISNLALTFSESYHRRVLLIDADVRRPSVHDVFGVPNVTGLSDALRSEAAVPKLVSVTRRLSVLPAGRPDQNPVGSLSSARMQALVGQAAAQFDWVLIDTPPVGLLPDAQHLTRLADAVVLVVAAGLTPYRLVQHAVGELGADRIFGTVLNRVEEGAIPAAPYYRQYYAPDGAEGRDSSA